MATNNPYSNVNWDTIDRIQAVMHEHGGPDKVMEMYNRGFRNIAMSESQKFLPNDPAFPDDYYGSSPLYPLDRFIENPPPDLVGLPNTEIASSIEGVGGHLITLGSVGGWIGNNTEDFAGDNIANSIWHVAEEKRIIMPLYPDVFEHALDGIDDPNDSGTIGGLLYNDGGGLVMPHSSSWQLIQSWLDAEPRFIGMANYNNFRMSDDRKFPSPGRGYYMKEWDLILSSGRRCWGFCESDRYDRGCNMLLLDIHTEETALQAYRNGTFYTKMDWDNNSLKFTKIIDHGNKIEVETEGAEKIFFITEKGMVKEENGNIAEYQYPVSDGEVDLTFVRVEAHSSEFTDTEIAEEDWPIPNYRDGVRYSDEIYSQPIYFRTKGEVDEIIRKRNLARRKRYYLADLL